MSNQHANVADIESHSTHRDVYDLLIAAAVQPRVVNRGGVQEVVDSVNSETMFWMTRLASFDKFTQLANDIRMLEDHANELKMHLEIEVAMGYREQILNFCATLRDVVSSKASETVFDDDNRQAALVDKMMSVKSEKTYHIDEAVKEGFAQSIFGQKRE